MLTPPFVNPFGDLHLQNKNYCIISFTSIWQEGAYSSLEHTALITAVTCETCFQRQHYSAECSLMLGCWTSEFNLDVWDQAAMLWMYENICIAVFYSRCYLNHDIASEMFSHFFFSDLKTPQSFLLNPALLWSDEDPSNWINIFPLLPLLKFDICLFYLSMWWVPSFEEGMTSGCRLN